MIALTAALEVWRTANGTWHFITVPEEHSTEIHGHAILALRGFGSVRIEACLHDVTWRTSVFPMKSGGYFLPVKKDILRKTGIIAGEKVAVELALLD